jgi:hypothetical protein
LILNKDGEQLVTAFARAINPCSTLFLMVLIVSNQNAPPGMGHNSGDYQAAIVTADEKRAFITSQIQLWVGYQHLDAALKAGELGQLSMVEKFVSLRNGLIVCRLNPRADTRLTVLILITFLADNNDGICHLSITATCQIFQRSREAIVNAIASLEEQSQIGVSRVGGMPNCYWPLIPAALEKMSGNPVWFANALRISGPKATSSKPFGAANRNPSSRVDQCSGVDQSAVELVNSSRPTRLVEPSSISSLIYSDEEDREARKHELPDWITLDDLSEWQSLNNSRGVKPGATNHKTADRSFTYKLLAGEPRAFADTDP